MQHIIPFLFLVGSPQCQMGLYYAYQPSQVAEQDTLLTSFNLQHLALTGMHLALTGMHLAMTGTFCDLNTDMCTDTGFAAGASFPPSLWLGTMQLYTMTSCGFSLVQRIKPCGRCTAASCSGTDGRRGKSGGIPLPCQRPAGI